ncbi:hypothetical protein HanXRQr2_Chr04g0163811 [Helianthus annuus]|uniref:Uncharacterized protein n=1 Tax=Helianthus annuus TaxID=4232 RepID=A0A9K3NRL1_HELAN|nr:hypothetical protein HanXRQr2_Chr04g0163811 [Helianthus annuus]
MELAQGGAGRCGTWIVDAKVLGLKGRTREHGSKFGPRVVGIKTRTPFPFKTSDNMLFIWKLGPMSLFKSSDIMWLTKLGP